MDANARRLARAEKKARAALSRLRASVTLLGEARAAMPDEEWATAGLAFAIQRVLRGVDPDVLAIVTRLSEVSP